jgi:hypothetical protein
MGRAWVGDRSQVVDVRDVGEVGFEGA